MSDSATGNHPVYALVAGDYRAEIAGVGGGIKALTYNGRDLVETYPDGADAPAACGVVLAPWPNRTEDGRFGWKGEQYQLSITEPERNNAIHGFVHERLWECEWVADGTSNGDAGEGAALRLRTDIGPRPGWPWQIRLTATYRLGTGGLAAEYRAETDGCPAPFALGVHTYLSAGGDAIDDCRLQLAVEDNLPLGSRNLPCGELRPAEEVLPGVASGVPLAAAGAPGTCRDESGKVWLDHCFRGAHPVARLTRPDGHGVQLDPAPGSQPGMRWVQVYTAPDFPDYRTGGDPSGPPRRALAVEPMSAPPNALASGCDITTLRPGAPASFALRIRAF